MPQICGVCRLPDRQEVEKALIAGEPLRNIAERFGTSAAAMFRHKSAHLPAKLVKAEGAREVAEAGALLTQLETIAKEARRLAMKAEKAGDLRTAALVGVRELVRIVELVGRLRGELQGGALVQVNVNTKGESAEENHRRLMRMLARLYAYDPAGFLEDLRRAAAESENEFERGLISYEEARARLKAREREPVRPAIEGETVG